jgi:thymidylate synthase (FAD)
MYVRWRWTASFQAVAHFVKQRVEHDAQFEIQQYAVAVRDLTRTAFPDTMDAIGL